MNRLWLRQIGAVARVELSRHLFTPRVIPLFVLALLPVLVAGLVVVVGWTFDWGDGDVFWLDLPGQDAAFYSMLYEFILRFVIYAGCVWIFMNLFRGEILDRSLHYYFLTPIRREVLVLGKFLSGWISATLLFSFATVASMVVLQLYHGPAKAMRNLLGEQFGSLLAYVGITALACIGYGAVFLAIGLFLRNPGVPALLIWVLEFLNPFLPGLLKKFSVIFYLQSLRPVAPDLGPFAVVADPVPAILSVPGLVLFSTAVLFAAALRIRTMEVAYGND